MSVKALQDYTSYAKYAHYNSKKQRRENWEEQIDRVFNMHERKLSGELMRGEFSDAFEFAKESVLNKNVLGSQRSLQWGGKGIEKHNAKMYNCSVTAMDRTRAFQELMFMLLCGCGVGFSVQKEHVNMLPYIKERNQGRITFVVDDSIEGWADAFGHLMSSFFTNGVEFPLVQGKIVDFDLSLIRPEGAEISGGFKAPGPEPLQKALDQVSKLIELRLLNSESSRLEPIDVYDICMYAADAVLSGGVRRSATICMFSADDDAMVSAKTGDWLYTNPQRSRSNNSAVLIKGETSKETFSKLMGSVKSFGEPGFVWSISADILYNPCVEIGMYPFLELPNGERKSGWQGCNLTEINGKKSTTKEAFLDQCKASAIVGTIQASYTAFPYLGEVSEKIFKREALLGCSITGMMDSPDILFNPEIQREGARVIKLWNETVANWIGIRPAARTTCVKPAGTTSLLLGTASGIHPHHAKRYMRTVEANKLEWPAQFYEKQNPLAVEESVWSSSKTDVKLYFLCEVPSGAITKNQMGAIELLDKVRLTQNNWVEEGTREELAVFKGIRHNVSNTITVKDSEWKSVEKYIFKHQHSFAGISLLSYSGDKDYPQAPNQTVLTPKEMISEYGEGAMFASGLIVDGLHAFDTLWIACDYALGNLQLNQKIGFNIDAQKDWIRRATQFSDRYFDGNVRKMTYCLKDVSNWKKWVDLKRTHVEIDWDTVLEPTPFYTEVNTMGAIACHGGSCVI